MRSPFKFLDAYSLKDKDAFFGRKEETDLLYEMVNKNRLVLVYGQSGSGKTSLVECGLANRFDVTDWYPIRVRRRQNLNASLQESLHSILIATEEEGIPLPTDLVNQVEEIYEEYLRPVYLIFDQLEEVFILGDKTEQTTFIQNIDHLYHSNIPCRIIFILREEYLGHLYNFEKVIPTLFDRRLRVEAINNTKIKEVLVKSFTKFNISLEAPAEDRLTEMVANICGEKTLVQLPYLQVYLDMLYREDYQRTYGNKERGDKLPPLEFTQAEIQEFGQIDEVLSKFLDFQEKEIQGILYQKHTFILDNTVLQIMDAFVTDEGTKRPLAYTRTDNLIKVDEKVRRLFPPVADEILSDCFLELEKARIIRGSDNYMELAHDSLAAFLTEKRGAEQKVRKRLAAALQEYELSGGLQLLAETQLLGMDEMLPSLYLDEATHELIEKSRKAIANAKAKEKAIAAKELAAEKQRATEERRLRRRAERNAKIARIRTWIAVFVSFLALVAGWWALQQRNIATSSENKARLQIRKTWGNEIAYKAGELLEKGHRNTAFQLASFTNRFIEKNNAEAAKVISDAYYYNDNIQNQKSVQQLAWNRNFHGHRGEITAIATSKDGRFILTGSKDKTVKLWQTDSAKVIQTFRGHEGEITAVAFSPDEQHYLSGGRDRRIKLWHLSQEKEVHTIEQKYSDISNFIFSPDGKSLLVTNNTIASLWAFDEKEPFKNKASIDNALQGILKESTAIMAIAFSPNGQYIVTGCKDKSIKIWSRSSVKLLHRIEVAYPIRALAFTKDGSQLLVGTVKNITKWRLKKEQLQKNTSFTFEQEVPISAFAFSPDRNFVLITANENNACKLWDIKSKTAKHIRTFSDHLAPITALVFSSGGDSILTGSKDHTVKLWKKETKKEAITLPTNNRQILAVAYAADEKIATGGTDNTITLWDKAKDTTYTLNGHKGWVQSLVFSSGGDTLLSGGKGGRAFLWDTSTGDTIQTFKGTSWIHSLDFSLNGTQILIGTQDNTAILWDIVKGSKKTLMGHSAPISTVAFSPSREMATGSFDGKIILRDKTGIPTSTLSVNNEVSSLVFSPDGKYLLTGCRGNNIAQLWDLASKKQLSIFEGHEDWITSVAYIQNDQDDYVLTTSIDQTIRLWESKKGREIRRFSGHQAAVTSIALSPDNNYLVSGSKDGTALMWTLNPDSIYHRQEADFALNFLNTVKFVGEFGISERLEYFPEAWHSFINTANHYELLSVGDFMYSEVVHNNNPDIYNRQYRLAEQCYQKAIELSNWDMIYKQRLAHLYYKWSQNLQESANYKEALEKGKKAHQLHPTEYFIND